MSNINEWIGVGLRHPHHTFFAQNRPSLGWLEIHSENYFRLHSPEFQLLTELRQDYAISCHGVGLSLGSADPLDPAHLKRLKALVDAIDPIFVSDHLSWSTIDGTYFNDLLPLPYTEEALSNFCQHVDQVQNALGREFLVENPSSYLRFPHSEISEWEFLAEVQRRTGCGLLLDLNNVYVSAFNHGYDCHEYLRALPADAVKEIHLAGFTVKPLEHDEIWIDTHSKPVTDDVWALYAQWTEQHGFRHTLIEWDSDIPEPLVLLAEAEKVESIMRRFCQEAV